MDRFYPSSTDPVWGGVGVHRLREPEIVSKYKMLCVREIVVARSVLRLTNAGMFPARQRDREPEPICKEMARVSPDEGSTQQMVREVIR